MTASDARIGKDVIDRADQDLDRIALVSVALPALCSSGNEEATCGAACLLSEVVDELRAFLREVENATR